MITLISLNRYADKIDWAGNELVHHILQEALESVNMEN